MLFIRRLIIKSKHVHERKLKISNYVIHKMNKPAGHMYYYGRVSM